MVASDTMIHKATSHITTIPKSQNAIEINTTKRMIIQMSCKREVESESSGEIFSTFGV
jgi:hypothetical protein